MSAICWTGVAANIALRPEASTSSLFKPHVSGLALPARLCGRPGGGQQAEQGVCRCCQRGHVRGVSCPYGGESQEQGVCHLLLLTQPQCKCPEHLLQALQGGGFSCFVVVYRLRVPMIVRPPCWIQDLCCQPHCGAAVMQSTAYIHMLGMRDSLTFRVWHHRVLRHSEWCLQEYGTGRFNKKHSTFYAAMMRELGLSDRNEDYLHLVPWQSLAAMNHNFLLTERRRHLPALSGRTHFL